ncbi:MAG TPA: alpha-ketoglutarate-dependent dioxygenase AlkB [Acidimicrobiales bacterium]|nr:alpha-ketoglutarate-dependent dioxygenase AlkB [Acidimicrobiales bacterium]
MLQLGLFSSGQVIAPGSANAERTYLGSGAWVDVARGWLQGADALFAQLAECVDWRHYKRWMYDRVVDDPRVSHWCHSAGELGLPVMVEIESSLRELYGKRLVGPGLNYYRDGRDSVAFHADRELRRLDDTLVAIVTLGATRSFLMRAKGGGRSVDFRPASGDLLVMGGACQAHFEHAVPKAATVSGGRISASWRWARR